jgi:hypothetical protein
VVQERETGGEMSALGYYESLDIHVSGDVFVPRVSETILFKRIHPGWKSLWSRVHGQKVEDGQVN